MNNKKLLVFVLVASIFSFNNVYAQDVCSQNGYTILTINGIFTDNIQAKENKENLKKRLPSTYNNEPVVVDYVYNATHLAGFGDLVDAARQGLFASSSDYDLVEMLDSASQKVKTQKLLLVGHSQGNFYANSFYDKIADKSGGVPAESIGVYSVATPDDHVAGGGKYLTSDTDTVIASIVGSLKNILNPNDHIELQKADGNGHSFSDVYLKYRSAKIVADIKSSFDKLKINNIQNTSNPCISPQDISTLHKVAGAVLSTGDFVVNNGVKASSFVYNSVKNTTTSVASTLFNIAKNSLALVGLIDNNTNKNEVASSEIVEPVLSNDTVVEEPITVIPPETIENPAPVNEVTTEEPSVTPEQNETTTPEVIETPVVTNGGGGTTVAPETSIPENTTPEDTNTNTENNNTDTTPPVITLIGENTINVEINGVYTEEGATALDDIDGSVDVVITGTIDNTKIGANIITYTATDTASNTSTLTRTINIINSIPVASTTSILSFPTSDLFKDDGLDISSGKKDTTLLTFQVIYRDKDNNPPHSLKLHIRNSITGVYLPDVDMVQIEKGEDELSDGNYENGELFTSSSTYDEGYYLYSIKLLDKDGNFFNINEDSSLFYFRINPYDHFYIPKYTFGTDNGDGNNWQVWVFNGSKISDWSDTYVNNYLHEQFKIEAYTGGFWCSNCLQRGIFIHDPQKGFDNYEMKISGLENNPQNNSSGNTYDVDIQWDSTGYVTTISHNNITDYSSHTDILNMDSDLWVGWDGSSNGFQTFPSGSWVGSPDNLMSGQNMMLTPYPVYDADAENTTEVILSSEKLMTSFSFDSFDPKVLATINNTDHSVNITVLNGTDVTNLTPTILFSDKASVNNLEIKDFTNPVEYTITAEDGSIEKYTVTVVVSTEIIIKKSSEKLITAFRFNALSPNVIAKTIDNENKTISIEVPYGINVANLSPSVSISDKATVKPYSDTLQNFTNPVAYTVTAEDGSTAVYTVTVTVSDPPIKDTIPPYIVNYTLDGAHGGISTNPIRSNLRIVISASENVNWLSIKIENVNDPTIYRMFQSDSTSCKDGTNTCSKVWDGLLSSGGLLKNGDYRIRVHMQDTALNDFEGYLPMTMSVIEQQY